MRRKDNIPIGCLVPLVGLAFIVMIAMEAPFVFGIGGVIFFIIWLASLLSKKEEEQKKLDKIYEDMQKENEYIENEDIMDRIDNLSGQDFETYLINVILPKDGYTNLQSTNYTGDYGIDIIAYKNDIKCAIQCKRANSKISNKAIQEVVAGRKHYKCDKSIVITNNYYTENAKQLAFDNKVELLDRDYIIRMIKKLK